MAKRFTDTEKWKDDWFCELSTYDKLTYVYILDNCDAVGVWKPNFKLAEFQLGFKIDWELFQKNLGECRLMVTEKFWWLRKFCDFQYGVLSETSKSKTTESYIRLLKNHRLWIVYTDPIHRAKEKDKEKDTVLINKGVVEILKNGMQEDHNLRDMALRVRGFTEEQFLFAIDDFLTTNISIPGALNRERGEIHGHFSNWCRDKQASIKARKDLKPVKKHQTADDKW